MSLGGIHKVTVDDKNRIVFPRKIVETLGDAIFLVLSECPTHGNYLKVVNNIDEYMKHLSESEKNYPLIAENLDFKNPIYFQTSIKENRRVTLDEVILKRLGINKDSRSLTCIGRHDHIVITKQTIEEILDLMNNEITKDRLLS